jgi:hypothetical protein
MHLSLRGSIANPHFQFRQEAFKFASDRRPLDASLARDVDDLQGYHFDSISMAKQVSEARKIFEKLVGILGGEFQFLVDSFKDQFVKISSLCLMASFRVVKNFLHERSKCEDPDTL